MKKLFILFTFMIFSQISNGQTTPTHLPASKSLVGIWRQTGVNYGGKVVEVKSGNYKVINPDGTFFTFVTWGMKDQSKDTSIGQYGTYKITSDSTLVENIAKHIMNPNLNGKDSGIKFRFINENTIMMAWSIDNKRWVNEKWTRLPLTMP